MIKWIGIIILGTLMIGSASGATLTVDDSGGAMYTKIQDAINAASDGDTIIVYNGTYYESITVNKAVTLRAWNTTYDVIVNSASSTQNAITVTANNVNISWLKVQNASVGSSKGINLNSVSGVSISENWVTLNSYGIFLTSSTNNMLTNNTVSGNTNMGVYLRSSTNNNLTNNTASSNGEGIRIDSSSNYNMLTNNNANGNSYGIVLTSSSSNTLANNMASYNSVYGIRIYDSSNNNVTNNNANGNSYGINLDWNGNSNTFTNNTALSNTNYDLYFSSSSTSNTANNTTACKIYDGDSNIITNTTISCPTITSYSNIIGYSATVAIGQNTFVQSSNGNFGLLLKGQTKTINNSVILNNTGDISAKVEARFNDSRGGVFGLVSDNNVLNATNFALGLPSSLMPLSSSGADVQVAVAPPGATALDARLGVPNEQTAGDYTGTVIITFSNNV